VPDPTTLTTDQLRRELAALRELLEVRLDAMDTATELHAVRAHGIDARLGQIRDRLREETSNESLRIRELIEARLDGMDRAIRLHAEIIDRLPDDRDKAISHLAGLHDEKFSSIAKQFAERDIRTDQATEAAKQALDAALLAQKELVAQQNEANAVAAAKAETSFTKQIDQMGTIIQTLEKALDARITELKERIDRGEGSAAGATVQRTEQRLTIGAVMAVIAGVVGVAAIIVTIVLATRH
jgi:hypothetical protein